MNKGELSLLLPEVRKIALSAGAVLIKYHKQIKKLNITVKEAQGVVSEADHTSEAHIIKKLKKLDERISFLAEEDAYAKAKNSESFIQSFKDCPYSWIIDPLDGTTNFLNGMDYFAICIALVAKKKPILGVVYSPITDECFFATQGQGSFVCSLKKKSKKIRLYQNSNKKRLKEGLFVTGFCSEKGELFDREFALFKKLIPKTRGIRRMGSAALDMCNVAKGVFDGFWEHGLAPWDVAAAGIICQEAGVKVTNYQGKAFHPFQDSIVASRTPLFKKLINEIKN